MAVEEPQRRMGAIGAGEVVVVEPRPLPAASLIALLGTLGWSGVRVAPSDVEYLRGRPGPALVSLVTGPLTEVVAGLVARQRTVVALGSERRDALAAAVAAGARLAVADADGPGELAACLRLAAAGEDDGGRSLRPRPVPRRLQSLAGTGLETLTAREGQVLEALIVGRRPSEIAADRFVSITTVRNQVQSILTKLNVHSQLEAVALAHRVGWPAQALD